MKYFALTRIAVAALALAAGTMPSMAAGPAAFGWPRMQMPVICQTDYQIRQRIAAEGFTNIYLNAPIGRHIQVRATQGSWVYLIDYNFCRPEIVSIKPFRKAR